MVNNDLMSKMFSKEALGMREKEQTTPDFLSKRHVLWWYQFLAGTNYLVPITEKPMEVYHRDE